MHAQKRGGNWKQLDVEDIASSSIAWQTSSSDIVFERRWALNLINAAFQSMHEWAVKNDKLRRYELLKPFVDGSGDQRYAEVAEELGISQNSVGKEVSRMRKRFRGILRKHVAATLSCPDTATIDDEIKQLQEILSRSD